MTDRMLRHSLILGGARSGKTRAALDWAESLGPRRRYVATAQAFDAEMAERIARHQAERGPGWETAEAPLDLVPALNGGGIDVAMVDCLTLWLSNLLEAGRDPEAETASLIDALAETETPVLMVSNEVGLGLVPETPLGRAFRDAQGRLNQAVAARVGDVLFVAAGLPVALKGEGRYRP